MNWRRGGGAREARVDAGEPRDEWAGAPAPAMVGRVVEPVYRAVIGWRNRRFDRGIGVTRLGVPVISVGNLSVGGTGKTPMVAHIVGRLLREKGVRPCIAMRGYRKRGQRVSDEADGYRRLFPGVPIVAQADRIGGLRGLFGQGKQPGPESRVTPTCVVLDDGFQHRQLARELDVVLIDASRPPMRDRLLPSGWLREPIESLQRAGAVVITHAELVSEEAVAEIAANVGRVTGRDIAAVTRHVWTGLVTGEGDGEEVLPLDWLLGKRVVGSCAIGNPAGFLHSLRATLAADQHRAGELVGTLVLPDHDPYDRAVVAALARLADDERADAIVVTDKDWSKLRSVPPGRWEGRPVVRPVLSMVFDSGQAGFDAKAVVVATGKG